MEKYKYRNHLNYIRCLRKQLTRVTVQVPEGTAPKNRREEDRFMRLALSTMKSIRFEYEACRKDLDFAQAIALWTPVKCYYLIYYLESIMMSQISGYTGVFSNQGHINCRRQIKQGIKDGTLIFSNDLLNQITTCKLIRSFNAEERETIGDLYYRDDKCVQSVLKKISDYKTKSVRQENNNADLRRAENRKLREKLDSFEITPIDFFYWMRIQTSYKIPDFLISEKDITPQQAAAYIDSYMHATSHYTKAIMRIVQPSFDLKEWF